MSTLSEIHNTIHALRSSEHDVCRAETIEAMKRANELQHVGREWRDWAGEHLGLDGPNLERMADHRLRSTIDLILNAATAASAAVPLADADITEPIVVDPPTFEYRDTHGLAAMLADMALPDVSNASRRVLPRGHRWPSADAARYGVDVVAAWVCRRVDGTTVVVRHHADGAWSTSAPDELDAAERPRRVVGHDSLDLAVARTTSELTGALVPVRLALDGADAGVLVPMSIGGVRGIRTAIDRALAAVTYLRAALEREEAIRG